MTSSEQTPKKNVGPWWAGHAATIIAALITAIAIIAAAYIGLPAL